VKYYYNNVPGEGLCRNNLIYTSLISDDAKTFVQWYYNDTEYHKNKNQVVESHLMKEKWNREVKFLSLMSVKYPNLVPKYTLDTGERKIYLEVDGPDFWEQAGCLTENYDKVLPDWQEQMLEIIQAHKDLGIYKYSMHPSSYFVVDGKLKSINYFFCYTNDDEPVTIREHLSHISENRQKDLLPKMTAMGLELDKPVDFKLAQHLCFESFRTNYPDDFIEEAKQIYV